MKQQFHETKGKTGTITGILYSVSLLLFLFSGAVVIVLSSRWLYRLDIHWLSLGREIGLTAGEVRMNYDALIDYNMLWHRSALIFPSLPMSANAAIHFTEVKKIFDGIQILFILSGILSVFVFFRTRNQDRWWLKWTGICAVLLPAFAGICILFSWERFFVTFHQLVFQNDYWLFDPATDPIILLLPDVYFLQCGIFILVLIFAGSMVCLVLYRKQKVSFHGTAAGQVQ